MKPIWGSKYVVYDHCPLLLILQGNKKMGLFHGEVI